MAALHSLSNLSSLNKERAQTLHWLVIVVLLLICSTLSVLCVFLGVFFLTATTASYLRIRRISIPDFIHYFFSYLNSWERASICLCVLWTCGSPCFPLASVQLVVLPSISFFVIVLKQELSFSFRILGNCFVDSLLALWRNKRENLEQLTDQDIIDSINTVTAK